MKLVRLCLLLLIQVLLSSTTSRAEAAPGREMLVIANGANPAAGLSRDEVKRLFLKQSKEWSNGEKVRPIASAGDVRKAFITQVLDMSLVDYERYWLERKYAAAESPPKDVDDDAAAVRYVAALKGGLSFVDGASLDEAARKKLKVVYTMAY